MTHFTQSHVRRPTPLQDCDTGVAVLVHRIAHFVYRDGIPEPEKAVFRPDETVRVRRIEIRLLGEHIA